MARVNVNEWMNAVESSQGPMPPELRHLCAVLSRTLPGDGSGAYVASREIGVRMGVHRSTVSRHIRELATAGWLELEERRTQYGRKGYRYFAAVPLALSGAPITLGIGAHESANNGNGARALRKNGAARAGIGAREVGIGAPGNARLLQTPTEKSAASPSPAQADSAAPEELDRLRAQVWQRLRIGRTDEEILGELSELGLPVTLDQVQNWRRLRELNPFRGTTQR